MKHVSFLTFAAAALFVAALHAAPVQAQPARVFVAAQGSDTNPCSFALPCRTFQRAHNVVAAGGEIDVLDPAGYGALTINKAISIQGHGFAGLAVASGDGIAITAGAADVVNLRGLLLDGVGTGANGIVFNAGAALDIQDCLIRNFVSQGIRFIPGASSALLVSATRISANGYIGVWVAPTGSGAVTAVLDHVVVVKGASSGIYVSGNFSTGTINAEIADSVSANNTIHGIVSESSAVAQITVYVRNSMIANNGSVGTFANGGAAKLRLIRSTVTGNSIGWSALTGATLTSSGDNNIDDNTNGNTAPPLLAPK